MSNCPFKYKIKHDECDWKELKYCNIAESFGDCPFKNLNYSDEFSHRNDKTVVNTHDYICEYEKEGYCRAYGLGDVKLFKKVFKKYMG